MDVGSKWATFIGNMSTRIWSIFHGYNINSIQSALRNANFYYPITRESVAEFDALWHAASVLLLFKYKNLSFYLYVSCTRTVDYQFTYCVSKKNHTKSSLNPIEVCFWTRHFIRITNVKRYVIEKLDERNRLKSFCYIYIVLIFFF